MIKFFRVVTFVGFNERVGKVLVTVDSGLPEIMPEALPRVRGKQGKRNQTRNGLLDGASSD